MAKASPVGVQRIGRNSAFESGSFLTRYFTDGLLLSGSIAAECFL
jgi:hypothetical protein